MKTFTLNFHVINDKLNVFHNDLIFSYEKEDLGDLFSIISNLKQQVNFTFDDGHLSDLEIVVPLLKKYNFTAIFFVIASEIENNQTKWEQTKRINDLGFTIGSHSYSHKKLTKLKDFELKEEFLKSKIIIENCINQPIKDFSFPYGVYNKRIIEFAIKSGYEKCYSTKGDSFFNSNYITHRFNVKSHHSTNYLINLIKNKNLIGICNNLTIKIKHFIKSIC